MKKLNIALRFTWSSKDEDKEEAFLACDERSRKARVVEEKNQNVRAVLKGKIINQSTQVSCGLPASTKDNSLACSRGLQGHSRSIENINFRSIRNTFNSYKRVEECYQTSLSKVLINHESFSFIMRSFGLYLESNKFIFSIYLFKILKRKKNF